MNKNIPGIKYVMTEIFLSLRRMTSWWDELPNFNFPVKV